MDTKSPEHTSFFIEIEDSLRHISVETKSMEDKLLELEEENAKLRELAKKALKCVEMPLTCEECYSTFKGCHLRGAMRELGIEVWQCLSTLILIMETCMRVIYTSQRKSWNAYSS